MPSIGEILGRIKSLQASPYKGRLLVSMALRFRREGRTHPRHEVSAFPSEGRWWREIKTKPDDLALRSQERTPRYRSDVGR